MHRTPRFTRSWIGKERPLSRYQTLDNSEGGQELDNLHNAHGTGTDGPATTTARGEIKVHDWPTAPLPLQRASKVDRFCAILLLLFPIPFIVLVITAAALNNKPLSEGGEDVFRLMKLGPTVYPLVFASVAGTTLRTIALWKAERGTTVGTLEKLLGSHTFVHAIENAVALRSLNFLTLSLLALWALSPIGGQGSLRLMYEANSTQVTEGVPMVYTKPDLTVPHIRDASTETWAGIVPRFEIDHIISASLTVSDAWRNNSVDPWGRPKIPVLKDIRDMVANNDHDWVDITPGVDTNFASLVGVGIPGFNTTLTQGETLNFTAPFEYLDSSCTVDSVVPLNDVMSHLNSTYGQISPSFPSNSTDPHITLLSPRPSRTGGIVRTNFFLSATSSKDSRTKRSDDAPLVWGLYGLGGVHVYSCSLNVVRVDAAVLCQGSTCTAQALRLSQTTDNYICTFSNTSGCLADLVSPFSLPLRRFLEFLPTAMSGINDYNCPIYEYMFGYPPQPARDPLTPPNLRDWSQIPESLMSSRLTTMLNTFWYAWLWNDEVYTRSSIDSTDRFRATTATRTNVHPIYKIDKGWAVALFFSSGVLLVLSVLNCIVLFRLRGPDPFGYTSVLLRDGVDSRLSKTGSALHGHELARLLAKEHVQLTDVQPEKDVGKIALVLQRKHERRRKRLERLRRYV